MGSRPIGCCTVGGATVLFRYPGRPGRGASCAPRQLLFLSLSLSPCLALIAPATVLGGFSLSLSPSLSYLVKRHSELVLHFSSIHWCVISPSPFSVAQQQNFRRSRMDATLPVDLRRFRPVVETSFRKIQDMEPMGDSPYVVITSASKMSPPLAATAAPEDPNVTPTAAAVRTDQGQQQQHQRSLKFSVENILDPTKFTGHPPTAPPRINNNIFHMQQPHHLFNHGQHPWLLPVSPANLLHHHHHHHPQQQQIHHMDVHSTSVESEDSLYDRSSDLESGAFNFFPSCFKTRHVFLLRADAIVVTFLLRPAGLCYTLACSAVRPSAADLIVF